MSEIKTLHNTFIIDAVGQTVWVDDGDNADHIFREDFIKWVLKTFPNDLQPINSTPTDKVTVNE